jgi:hypothetical protein
MADYNVSSNQKIERKNVVNLLSYSLKTSISAILNIAAILKNFLRKKQFNRKYVSKNINL